MQAGASTCILRKGLKQEGTNMIVFLNGAKVLLVILCPAGCCKLTVRSDFIIRAIFPHIVEQVAKRLIRLAVAAEEVRHILWHRMWRKVQHGSLPGIQRAN